MGLYVGLAAGFSLAERWLFGKGWGAAVGASLVLAAAWTGLNYRAELRRAWRRKRVRPRSDGG